MRAYLLGIARKQVLQHRDKLRRAGERQAPLERSVQGHDTSPSVAVARSERQRIILAALQQVPLDYQIALELYYWEEMSVAEIARVLDVAGGTVKARLHHAREALREKIHAVAENPRLADETIQGLQTWIESLRARIGGDE